jgi:hypothetical protein
VKKWFLGDFPELKDRLKQWMDADETMKSNRFLLMCLIDFSLLDKDVD